MDFSLTEDQIMFRDSARDFAAKEIEPHAIEIENTKGFPREVTQKLAAMGFLGLNIPEQYGGAGADYLAYCLCEEEIARSSISVSMTMGAHNSLVAPPLLANASEELKQKFLPKIASGETLTCWALTEPNAGSDPVHMETVAVKKGDRWVLNGRKIFITNGSVSDNAMVYARTGVDAKGRPELSCFMLDRTESKYENGTDEDKMGLKGSPTSELIFNDVEVPAENLVGKQGEGFKIAMDSLNAGRISVAGQALAVAEAAYERAKKYAFERKQFGKRLGDFQAIQFMIADMSVDVEAARSLIYRAIEYKYRGAEWYDHYIMASAQAKLFSSEMAIRVTDRAVQVHGGYGYCKDYRVEEHYRAARIMPIIEGTSEIQRITIFRRLAKELGY